MMTRRDFLRSAMAGGAMLAMSSRLEEAARAGGLPLSGRARGRRPNIVFVMVDDMGYGDLGVYGQKHIRMSCVDRMAREGIRYTNVYAGSTVCAPSRSVLMKGQHTGHTTVRGNTGRPGRGGVPCTGGCPDLSWRLMATPR